MAESAITMPSAMSSASSPSSRVSSQPTSWCSISCATPSISTRAAAIFFCATANSHSRSGLRMNRLAGKVGEKSIEDHYRAAYQADQPGYQAMLAALDKLAAYAKAHNIRLYFAMTPDIHNLANYPFGYIHERMLKIAAADGYAAVDLLPAFGALPPEQVWAMPGDPHPNALGHRLMAEAVYPAAVTKAVGGGSPVQLMLFSDPVFFVVFRRLFRPAFAAAGAVAALAGDRRQHGVLRLVASRLCLAALRDDAWPRSPRAPPGIDARKEQRGGRLRLAATSC